MTKAANHVGIAKEESAGVAVVVRRVEVRLLAVFHRLALIHHVAVQNLKSLAVLRNRSMSLHFRLSARRWLN